MGAPVQSLVSGRFGRGIPKSRVRKTGVIKVCEGKQRCRDRIVHEGRQKRRLYLKRKVEEAISEACITKYYALGETTLLTAPETED